MKKLVFFLLVGGLFFACNKEDVQELTSIENATEIDFLEKNEITPQVSNGYLVFECEEKMEEFIIKLTKSEVDPTTIASTFGFNSYLEHVPQTEQNEVIFGDKYFAATLNMDGMIGVGTYIFKVNPPTEEVFVISNSAGNKSIKALKNAQSQNNLPSNALVFSFEDEIFELLEKGATCEEKMGCDEDCSPPQRVIKQDFKYCGENDEFELIGFYWLQVRYSKVGFWKYANIHFQQGAVNGISTADWDIRYSARWKRKCRTPIGSDFSDYVCSFVPLQGEDQCFPFSSSRFKNRLYQSTRCLSAYDIRADARIESICDETQLIWTGEARISHNLQAL